MVNYLSIMAIIMWGVFKGSDINFVKQFEHLAFHRSAYYITLLFDWGIQTE